MAVGKQREKLLGIISKELVPIRYLSQSDKNTIIEQGNILTYEAGSYIFEQGDTDDFTYYLLEGELEMQSLDESIFHVTTETDMYLNPLSKIQPRQYSAKALTSITVLQINRDVLDSMPIPHEGVKSNSATGS